jgi:hypothetical protein
LPRISFLHGFSTTRDLRLTKVLPHAREQHPDLPNYLPDYLPDYLLH